jgi:hypothetical protein
MKKVIITQSNYIPWKAYFESINMVDTFVVYDDMQYTKRDWRNRNQIKTHQGVQWLSIPVEVKGKFFQKINETIVSDKKWGGKHWEILKSNYSKAPFYKDYKDCFEAIYRNEELIYLTDINVTFIKTINKLLGITTEIIDSRDFVLLEGKTERLVDVCKKINATDYFTGPASKNYMDESLFEQESISVHYFDYSGYPEYPQLFGEFTHAVSILDLIFNVGPNFKQFMKSFNQ